MSDRIDPEAVLAALRTVLPEGVGNIALHEPFFCGKEWIYVRECLEGGWVSSVGKFVDRFEAQLAEYTGAKSAIAVVNGTAALHACLLLAGVQPGDEVIVPTLTFVATANAVMYCSATPHFADSEYKTLGMDATKLDAYLKQIGDARNDGCFNRQTGRRITAVVPMHTFGHPIDLDALDEVCRRHHLSMVEDAAESLGSFYKGRHTGNKGVVSSLSFNGNKVITTGGGGAIITNDIEMGRLAKHMTTTARVSHPWELSHNMVGYNYRMPNINAALGCAQLEQLPSFLAKKRALAAHYREAFSGITGITFFTEPDHGTSNYWLNTILIDEQGSDKRDTILALTNSNGIQTRPAWTPMHRLPMYASCPRMDLSVAEDLSRRLINLPSSAILGRTHAEA